MHSFNFQTFLLEQIVSKRSVLPLIVLIFSISDRCCVITPAMISQDNYLLFFLLFIFCLLVNVKLLNFIPPCFGLIISRFSYHHPASKTKEINSWLITHYHFKKRAKHSPIIKEVFLQNARKMVQQTYHYTSTFLCIILCYYYYHWSHIVTTSLHHLDF